MHGPDAKPKKANKVKNEETIQLCAEICKTHETKNIVAKTHTDQSHLQDCPPRAHPQHHEPISFPDNSRPVSQARQTNKTKKEMKQRRAARSTKQKVCPPKTLQIQYSTDKNPTNITCHANKPTNHDKPPQTKKFIRTNETQSIPTNRIDLYKNKNAHNVIAAHPKNNLISHTKSTQRSLSNPTKCPTSTRSFPPPRPRPPVCHTSLTTQNSAHFGPTASNAPSTSRTPPIWTIYGFFLKRRSRHTIMRSA
jgi:hypothetical protein